jgi:predicted nucleotidyltransferase
MSTYNGLADLLFGRTRGAILALLFGHADQSFYTRQIAREVDVSVGAVQRELENLSKVGLIVRNSVGSQVFYRANRDAPIFREMHGLVNKTVGIFSVLRSALHPLAKRVLVAFVYGSLAREEETAQSDVDLLVVGKATLEEVLSLALYSREEHQASHQPDRIFRRGMQVETCERESFFDRRAQRPKSIPVGRRG